MSCIFCKIASGEAPAYKPYETDTVVSFLDIQPCVKGHTMVIPKKHVETILELNDAEIKDLFVGVREVTQKIKQGLGCESFNIGINHGPHSNRGLEHLHVHIIPRWAGDKGGSMHTIVRTPSDESVEETYKKIAGV